MQCGECSNALVVGAYARGRSEATAIRCMRCGSTHGYKAGGIERITPTRYPIGTREVVSPWYPWRTRPVMVGEYECRFTDTEPHVLRLWWNGLDFTVSQEDARCVRMKTFMGWRGSWSTGR